MGEDRVALPSLPTPLHLHPQTAEARRLRLRAPHYHPCQRPGQRNLRYGFDRFLVVIYLSTLELKCFDIANYAAIMVASFELEKVRLFESLTIVYHLLIHDTIQTKCGEILRYGMQKQDELLIFSWRSVVCEFQTHLIQIYV